MLPALASGRFRIFAFLCPLLIRLTPPLFAQAATMQNLSRPDPCAEHDNINIPLSGSTVRVFEVVATPAPYPDTIQNCDADFSGCGQPAQTVAGKISRCIDLWKKDNEHIIKTCQDPAWWRPNAMTIRVGADTAVAHRLGIHQKLPQSNSWPEFFSISQDGSMRLIPHPNSRVPWVCYGASVIIGPAAEEMERPFADIEEISVDPPTLTLNIRYRNRQGQAQVQLTVDSTRAVARITVQYNRNKPFATYRSMWVADGKADVDHISGSRGSIPILGNWKELRGNSFFFNRQTPSSHNSSAPDIRINVLSIAP
jgi:hypothetical protein